MWCCENQEGEDTSRVAVSHADPLQCLAKGKGLEEAKVGQESHFTMKTRDSKGKRHYCGQDLVVVKIQTQEDEELEPMIEDHKNGNYTVSYTPISVGPYDVIIKVNDEPLADSPWRPEVTSHQYQTVFTFGSRGSGPGQFADPIDIAVSKRTGNIAVADCKNKRVQMFSSKGKFLTEFGQKGPGAERIGEPSSVAFSRSGDVIVVHSKKMSLFTESGRFIKHIVNEHLEIPWKVSVESDGQLIVSEGYYRTINVLTPDGTQLLKSFKVPECDIPPSFAVFHQNKFFVSCPSADCVKVFSKEGVFLYNIGTKGTGHGQFNWPHGITINTFNNLMVCDSFNHRVQEFSLGGKFINEITVQVPGTSEPWAVDLSKDGQVIVTDFYRNCVYILK